MLMFLLLVASGFVAGLMNAVAGGGSLVTLPILVLAGLPSVSANASSTVALFPGTVATVAAYRRDPIGLEGVSTPGLFAVSVGGGLLGAGLLLVTPSPTFDRIVPWLLLLATLVFAFGKRLGEALRGRARIGAHGLIVAQALLAVYAGYFGGGVGVMMLAVWSLMATADIQRLNPTKSVMAGAANGAAVFYFVSAGEVRWPQTLCVLIGAVAGGYGGARVARRMPPHVLRAAIVVIASVMTVVFFARGI